MPAPFFPEYRVFTEASGGVLVPVPPRADLQIDLDALRRGAHAAHEGRHHQFPEQPSGVIFDEENLRGLAEVLRRHEKKTGEPVYLITDEPYRELVFDGSVVHSAIEFYDDTILCYSFSKSLSVRASASAIWPSAIVWRTGRSSTTPCWARAAASASSTRRVSSSA